MKKLIIISSLLIVVLIGYSKSENDDIINNVEEINKEKEENNKEKEENNKEKHLYYYDENPIEFLGVWELKKDSTIRTLFSEFYDVRWESRPIPKKLEFKIDTSYIANTTLTIHINNEANDDEVIFKKYWRLHGHFIEASTYEPYQHPIWGQFREDYFLPLVSYDENNMVIHIFNDNDGFLQLEYKKKLDYNVDENIFKLTKR